jgi:hypothetical protein
LTESPIVVQSNFNECQHVQKEEEYENERPAKIHEIILNQAISPLEHPTFKKKLE